MAIVRWTWRGHLTQTFPSESDTLQEEGQVLFMKIVQRSLFNAALFVWEVALEGAEDR